LDSYGLVLISWLEVEREVSAAILCSTIKNRADHFFSNKKIASPPTIFATLDVNDSPIIMPP